MHALPTPLEISAVAEAKPHELFIFLSNCNKLRGIFLTGSKKINV